MQRRRGRIRPSTEITSTISRAEIAAQITSEDMQVRLQHLAENGRRDDCLALMRELGSWQSRNKSCNTEQLVMPYLGTLQ